MSLVLDGTNGLTYPNSTVQASAGVVLQVVSAAYNTATNTSSSTYVTTGLTASITPKFSTSKILILVSIPFTGNGTGFQNTITLYRNSTNIALTGSGQQGFGQTYTNAGSIQSIGSITYLDFPATTSSTSYTVYFAVSNGTTAQVFNNYLTGTITLMEIAA